MKMICSVPRAPAGQRGYQLGYRDAQVVGHYARSKPIDEQRQRTSQDILSDASRSEIVARRCNWHRRQPKVSRRPRLGRLLGPACPVEAARVRVLNAEARAEGASRLDRRRRIVHSMNASKARRGQRERRGGPRHRGIDARVDRTRGRREKWPRETRLNVKCF